MLSELLKIENEINCQNLFRNYFRFIIVFSNQVIEKKYFLNISSKIETNQKTKGYKYIEIHKIKKNKRIKYMETTTAENKTNPAPIEAERISK